nr:HipA domain-containing protein [Microcella frigidaquae]
MGALEFVPDRSPAAPVPTALELASLIETARAAVSGTLDNDRHSADALRQIISVGTSAGGARAKAVVTIDDATGEIRPGHALPRPGEGSWLLKFDGVGADHQLGESQQYTRIEYAYSLMARAAGIRMPETRLLAENGRAHFLTRRFDRVLTAQGAERWHLQSLCGLAAVDFTLRGTNDYAQLFTAAAALGLSDDDRTEIFRRMAFNVAAANHDDHSKNHAFLLPPDGDWQLSPAYDITYARDADNIWLRQHLMSVGGRFTDITRADLLAVADRFAVPGAKAALRRIDQALDAWGSFAAEAGVRDEVAAAIGREFTRVG